MWSVYALLVNGSGLAALGVITLAAVPGWHVTKGDVLWFVFGAFIGMSALMGLAALAAPYLLALLGVRRDVPHGELIGNALLVMGAEVGGTGLLFLSPFATTRKQPAVLTVREIDPEFFLEPLFNPCLGLADRAEGHGLPSNALYEGSPHAGQGEAVISGRGDGEQNTGHSHSGDAGILGDYAGDVGVIDVHGFDGGEVDEGVSPFTDFVGSGQETGVGGEKIFDDHGAAAVVDNAHGIMPDFHFNWHRLTLIYYGLYTVGAQPNLNGRSYRSAESAALRKSRPPQKIFLSEL